MKLIYFYFIYFGQNILKLAKIGSTDLWRFNLFHNSPLNILNLVYYDKIDDSNMKNILSSSL